MEVIIQLTSHKQVELFGPADSHLRLIRQSLGIQITARQNNLIVSGKEKDVKKAAEIIDKMQKQLTKRGTLTKADVNFFLTKNTAAQTTKASQAISVYSHKKVIEANTKGQLKYIETMLANDLTADPQV